MAIELTGYVAGAGFLTRESRQSLRLVPRPFARFWKHRGPSFVWSDRRCGDLPIRDGRYEVPVEARWSSGAIEQHGDARSATAHVNDDTTPVGNLWASSGTKLAHPETHTDSNSVDVLVIHYRYPV